MKIRQLLFLSLAMGATVALAADGLDVKPGLWQMSFTTEARSTSMPPEAMAKLTPEQRAKVAAALQKQAERGPRTFTRKTCITAEDLKAGAFREAEDDKSCKYVVKEQTRVLQEGTLVCTGDEPHGGTMRVEAIGRDHIKGSVGREGPNGKISMQMTGEWISTSCAGADEK